MPNTPPNSGKSPGNKPEASVQEQLDDLLVKIETEEPGTINPEILPESFRTQQMLANIASKGDEAEAPATPDGLTAEDILNQPPAVQSEAATTAEPQPQAATETETDTNAEQEAMLAALNTALQGIGSNNEQDASSEEQAPTPEGEAAATETVYESYQEDKLQQEIAALMNSELGVAAEAPAAEQAPAGDEAISTEDQIAMEIEGLLNADQPAAPEQQQPQQQEVDETSIDELDQMLANEIDEDDELLGDFHTVEAITAGIETAQPAAVTTDDQHAATARDVAAELDTQPENLATAGNHEPAPDEDPFAALSEIAQAAEKNEQEYQERVRLSLPVWVRRFKDAKERLLKVCFALNWPARRFLTTEWRANLGYIALLNLFFGVGIWLYLIVR